MKTVVSDRAAACRTGAAGAESLMRSLRLG